MSPFAVDHVVVRVPDPDALAARISEAMGLPVLRGWTPDGVVRSRGVRFANDPFLDIHAAPEPQPAWLGLAGPIAQAARLAAEHGWLTRGPEPDPRFPWKILLFRGGQGALTNCFVIDYDRASPLWDTEEFSGELFRPLERGQGAPLVRVIVAAPEAVPGAPDLLPPSVLVEPGPAAEVIRLEVEDLRLPALQLTPRLTLAEA